MTSEPLPTDAARTPYPWRRQVLICSAIALMFLVSHLLVGWFNGRGLRLWSFLGFLAFTMSAIAVAFRRRWIYERRPELAAKRLKFSTVDLLILVTGMTLFVGFTAADQLDLLRAQRNRERLQAEAASVLGPDGWVGFEPDWSVSLTICDRTFDDERLVELAAMVRSWHPDVKVNRLMFASGRTTGATPAAWPGVTDQSVPLMLEWDDLEWLSVDGTSISDAGREELLTLPRLNDFSRQQLERSLQGAAASGP